VREAIKCNGEWYRARRAPPDVRGEEIMRISIAFAFALGVLAFLTHDAAALFKKC
jgi:hypothetical protein